MQTEFEVKILEIDVDKIKKKLEELKAKKVSETIQKRYVYDFDPVDPNSWIRLRTNGKKTTLAIKEIQSEEIDGTKELEVSVDDFKATNLILKKMGYIARNFQENKRISYDLDGIEIDIDFWPKIPPYLEIEGKSSEEVKKMIIKLGFDESETTSIGTTEVYKKYGIDLLSVKELKFDG